MNTIKLKSMLEQFYIEDIGDGDLSSELLFPEDTVGELSIVAKMDGIFCGKKIIEVRVRVVDRNASVNCHVEDGSRIDNGTVLAVVLGPVRSLLKCFCVILNLIQRMSAIATATNRLMTIIDGTGTKKCVIHARRFRGFVCWTNMRYGWVAASITVTACMMPSC